MKVVGYTDIMQVAALLAGGLLTTCLVLALVSEKRGRGRHILAGLKAMIENANDHFYMPIDKPAPGASPAQADKYLMLFAGPLTLLMPMIVMLAGIAACVPYKNGALRAERAPGRTFGIYERYLNSNATGQKQVGVGRLTICVAMLPGIALTWQDLLGIGSAGGFSRPAMALILVTLLITA